MYAHAHMQIYLFIYFKDAVQTAKLRVEIIMTRICLLWRWHPNRHSVRLLSFQNILPSCHNCYMLWGVLIRSVFKLLRTETFIPYYSETAIFKNFQIHLKLCSLQDLPIYSNCVKLWQKLKKTRIDYACHSCWLRGAEKARIGWWWDKYTIVWKRTLPFQAIYNISGRRSKTIKSNNYILHLSSAI